MELFTYRLAFPVLALSSVSFIGSEGVVWRVAVIAMRLILRSRITRAAAIATFT